MTASVGPRSELILPGRVGRLLDPAAPAVAALPPDALARRPIPSARAPRPALATRGLGGPERVPARRCRAGPAWCTPPIDLRGPVPLFVRGVLVVLLDAAVLALALVRGRAVAGARLAPAPLAEPLALVPGPPRGRPSARSSSCPRSASRRGASLVWPRRSSGAATCSSPRPCAMRCSPPAGLAARRRPGAG